MDKKKILIIGSIVAVILSIVVIIYAVSKPKEEEDLKLNGINLPTNKEVLKDTTVEKLKITEQSLIIRNGTSNFKATVTNKTDQDIKINQLYVIFYTGNKPNKNLVLYNGTIPSNESTYINLTLEEDLTNITKIEYVHE